MHARHQCKQIKLRSRCHVSGQSFKHCSCCVRTPLVWLLRLCPHSCYTCTSLHFRTQDVGHRCRFQTTWNLFNDVEGGKHKLCAYGAAMAKSRWAGTPSYDHRLIGIHFFPRPCQNFTEKLTRHSLLQQLPRKTFDRWYCHGNTDSQVSSSLAAHLAVRPPLAVASHHDFWPSRVNLYSRSRRRTHSGEVRSGSLNKFRPISGRGGGGGLVLFNLKYIFVY